jgi:hypothetical protein
MLSASRRFVRIALAFACIAFAQRQTPKTAKTDAEIRQAIINESIASYRANRGNCPCPYNTDRAGHKCGARSAYSRPGGASPIYYEKDVIQKMVDECRKRSQ